MSVLRVFLLALLLSLSHQMVHASVSNESQALFSTINDALRLEEHSADNIDAFVAQVSTQRKLISGCVVTATENLSKLKRRQALLSVNGQTLSDNPENIGLTPELRNELNELNKQIEQEQGQILACQLQTNRAEELLETLTEAKANLLVSRISEQSRTAVNVVNTVIDNRDELLSAVPGFLAEAAGRLKAGLQSSINANVMFVIALLLGLYVSRLKTSRIVALHKRHAVSNFDRFRLALTEALLRFAAWILPLSLASVYWLSLAPQGFDLLKQVCYLLTAFTWSLVLVRTFLQPGNDQWQFIPIEERRRDAMARRLRIFLVTLMASFALSVVVGTLDIPAHLANLARLLVMLGVIVNLIWLIWLIDGLEILKGRGEGVRRILAAILSVALLAELAGYLNFSAFLIRGFIGTLVAIFLLWLLNEFTREVFDGLDSGKRHWQRNIRERLAVEPGSHVPGLVWFRFFALIAVWILAAMAFLQAWELSEVSWAWFRAAFEEGFLVGETRIVPARLLSGVLLFATLLLLSNSIKSALSERSTIMARLEPSARETAITLTGYTGFTVALIIGLSLAGFSFQNLAIVAGALSVGIGFGLQNIVNNFVSGIILLFERPIRRGDWVVVGGTEGTVKNIRVRSTEIETFDRSDVVVPNSEFISQQVTNMTLNDPFGRVKVAIGVAYGTDVEKVRELLLQVANEHGQVLKEGNFRRVPKPSVLFMGFGDSSLDFELRCFIRDIRDWPFVRSDLNFAINAAFVEHNIEIPFPQRDVHIKPQD